MDLLATTRALEELLDKHSNKVVVAFNLHGNLMRKFFWSASLWQMLANHKFTDRFLEGSSRSQSVFDRIKEHYKLHANLPDYFVEATRQARPDEAEYRIPCENVVFKNGITTTFVDRGLTDSQFIKALDAFEQALAVHRIIIHSVWNAYATSNQINRRAMSFAEDLNAGADYVRSILDTPEGVHIKRNLENLARLSYIARAREDDEATGRFAAEVEKQAVGRVFMIFGLAHFSPSGVQAYLENPLVLQFFENRQKYMGAMAMRQNSGIFLEYNWPLADWTESHVVLLEEGKSFEIPAKSVPQHTIDERYAHWKMVTQIARRRVESESLPQLEERIRSTVGLNSGLDSLAPK